MNNIFFYISFFLIILILPIYSIYIIRKKKSFKPISLKKQIINHSFIINIFITLITTVYIVFFLKIGFLLIHDKNIENVLQNSQSISNAYYEESREKIINDILIISRALSSQSLDFFNNNKEQIQLLIESYSSLKDLSEIIVFVPSKNIILAKNNLSFALTFETLPISYLFEANKEQPILIENLDFSKIKALIELDGFPNKTYLIISRYLDEKIINYILESKNAINSYENIKKDINKMQNIFLFIFILIIAISLFFIKFLIKIINIQTINPINEFVILASEKNIENIDLSIIKNKKTNILELNILIQAFNSIIEKLNDSKKEIDEHNKFINAIFSETPYGIFIFDSENFEIIMQNNAVNKILNSDINNNNLYEVKNFYSIKEDFLIKIKKLFEQIINNKNSSFEETIEIKNLESSKIYNFLVKIIMVDFNYLNKNSEKNKKYFLVIFNDITDHIELQKTILWIDVARRITHEIRNPLTPILLSIERLEYKYADQIEEKNRDNFIKYINNVKKHTLTISWIIDEFIDFGKMPEPKFVKINLINLINDSINASYFDKRMKYDFTQNNLNENQIERISNFLCDEKQILRMFLNIFKNSYEAFFQTEEKNFNSYTKDLLIKIILRFERDDCLNIFIEDNGPGFALDLIDKITEPYITTKKRGTGLGLSIVKRIIIDHNAQIFFENLISTEGSLEVLGARTIIKFFI
jgi:two-component system nitrogen regulation sensor histidine kinase NtrY